MENIGQSIDKDYDLESRPDPDLRTLDELVRLVELRLHELEKRMSYLEVHRDDVQFIEVVRTS